MAAKLGELLLILRQEQVPEYNLKGYSKIWITTVKTGTGKGS
jgi:hypothetical protein